MALSVLHSLGFDCPHTLLRQGDIHPAYRGAEVPEPHVYCLFRPSTSDLSSTFGTPVSLPLPLAMALDLRPGDIVLPDGQVSTSTRISHHGIAVDTSRSRSLPRKAMAEAGYLPSTPGGDIDIDGGFDRSMWHLLPVSTGRFRWAVLPALLMFMSYYASNSRLASAYLSQDFLDVLAHLKSDTRNRIDTESVAKLYLGRNRLTGDAEPLGRVLFDSTGIAERRAIQIANDISLANRKHTSYTLNCGFPFDGQTRLKCKGVEHVSPDTGERVLVILHIEQCTYPLPWRQLHIYPERTRPVDDGTKGDKSGSSNGSPGAICVDFGDDFVPLTPDAEMPAPQPALVVSTRSTTRFSVPGPSSMTVHRGTHRRVRGTGPRLKPTKKVSPHPPSSKGDPTVRGVVTSSSELSEEVETEEKNKATLSPVMALDLVIHALRDFNAHDNGRWRPLDLSESLVQYADVVLNQIPATTNIRPSKWETIRDGRQARCLLVAELERNTHYAYLFEILRNPHESFSTLMVSRKDRVRIETPILRQVFETILRHEGLPTNEKVKVGGVEVVTRVSHRSPESLRRSWIRLMPDVTT